MADNHTTKENLKMLMGFVVIVLSLLLQLSMCKGFDDGPGRNVDPSVTPGYRGR